MACTNSEIDLVKPKDERKSHVNKPMDMHYPQLCIPDGSVFSDSLTIPLTCTSHSRTWSHVHFMAISAVCVAANGYSY